MFKTWWLRFPVVTFAILAAAFSIYYLFYVRDKQEYLVERSFRLLGAMSERVEDQLLTSRRVVKNAPDPFPEKKSELGQPVSEPQTSEPPDPKKLFEDALKLADPPLEAVYPDPERTQEKAVSNGDPTDREKTAEKAVANGDLPVLTERLTNGSEWFYFQYGKARARAKVEEVIGPVLELEGFDKLLFASSDGRVLFQQGQQDMRLVTLSGLRKKDGSFVDVLELGRSSHLLDVEVAGQAYKLFVQPCSIARDESVVEFPSRLGWTSAPAGKDEKKEPSPPDQQVWLLCGLKSADGLRMEAASISASLATVLVALSVLIAFSFPFLKLICIGPEERLRAIDGLLAALCGFLGISFLTILLLDALALKNLAADSRRQLAELSKQLSDNFSTELDDAYRQLKKLNESALEDLKTEKRFWSQGDLLVKGGLRYKNPYTFVWVNEAGEQIVRWSILREAHPPVPVANRQYFKNALRERLWTRCIDGELARFWLEPVRIATTGQNLAVLSIQAVSHGKFVLPGGPPCKDYESPKFVPPPTKSVPKDVKDPEPKVATLSSFMISVNRPVLPPGFGFAVVDSEGKVLFHSNPRRALHENLLAETDSDRALRAYLFARRQGFVSSRYAGREHLLHVAPVPYVPLSVVAFRDKTLLRTVNTEIILTTLTCLIAYALLFIVLFGTVYLIPAFRARWIWPDRSRIVAYRQLTMVYAVFLFLAAPLLLKFLDASHSLWMGMLIPLFFLAVSYVRVRMDTASPQFDGRLLGVLIFGIGVFILVLVKAGDLPRPERTFFYTGLVLCLAVLFLPGTRSWFESGNAVSPRSSYLLTGALLLAILSVFPALMFFNMAFQLQAENFIKHGQARLAEALKEREDRVRFQYRKVRGAEEHLKDRLALAQTDVYAKSFYNTVEYRCEDDKCGLEEAADHFWLPAFLEDLLPLYNDTSVEVAKLAKDKADAKGRWWRHWDETPGVRKLVLHGTGHGRAESVHLESELPRQFREVRANLWWLLPGVLLLTGTVWGTVSFIARRLLLLRMEAPPWMRDPNPQDPAIGSNTFYVLLPGDGAPPLTTQPGVETIDLAAPPRDLRAEAESARIRNAKIVHLAHLEHKLKDRPYTLQKLALLEDLVRSGKRVVVSSEVDPHFELTSGSLRDNGFGGREAEARWKSLLDGFAVKHGSSHFEKELQQIRNQKAQGGKFQGRIERNLDTIKRECCPSVHLQKIGLELARADLRSWDRVQLLDEILDRTDEHYRLLWQTLSPEEKLAVVQLAEEGLVNPNNRKALRKLILRGLVVRNPALQPMNETFRRFVTTGLEYAEVTRMEKEDRESTWVRLQRPLLTVLVGVALFFFVTQRETFDLTLLFITTLAAALPQLLKLVNYLGARMAEGEQS